MSQVIASLHLLFLAIQNQFLSQTLSTLKSLSSKKVGTSNVGPKHAICVVHSSHPQRA